jgi:hypothetical protein
VSSGRGTQALFYAKEFGGAVIGVDILEYDEWISMLEQVGVKNLKTELDGKIGYGLYKGEKK